MVNTAETGLLSTGELARRLQMSQAGVRKAERAGRIPPSILITGSGRKVWRAEDFALISEALQESRRRKYRTAA